MRPCILGELILIWSLRYQLKLELNYLKGYKAGEELRELLKTTSLKILMERYRYDKTN